jgi:hypothetical protein
MNLRLTTAGTVLLCAGLLQAQPQSKTTGPDAAASREADRQARVALDPNATQSPTESEQQAIAFERYKDQAARREAQKQAGEGRANPKQTAAAKRK